jgi:putative serine protease PepD
MPSTDGETPPSPSREPRRSGRGRTLRTAALATALVLAGAIVLAACGADRGARPAAPAASTPTTAGGLQQKFVDVVQSSSPAVVQIKTDQGLGSGVVFDDRGDIVTNAHVVDGASRFQVTLADGARHPASLVGADPQNDIAVVRLHGARPKPAVFANSANLEVGDLVLALGNPLGLRSSVTEGIVSSLSRSVSEGNGVTLPSAIQTSAAINPGNSGGALVDLSGRVVGIPTLAALDPDLGGAQAPGIGFAIPSSTVTRIARGLIRSGAAARGGRPYLGVDVATLLNGGVAVAQVVPGGPAAHAGIHAGDIILAVAGQQTPSADVLTTVIDTLRPGRRVPVTVLTPSGSKRTVQLVVGVPPAA